MTSSQQTELMHAIGMRPSDPSAPLLLMPITEADVQRILAVELCRLGRMNPNITVQATMPGLALVALTGSYADLLNTPAFGTAAFANITAFATAAQGALADSALQSQVNADWLSGSGASEILNKPSIPAAQVNSDWNASSGVAQIFNKPTLGTAAAQNTTAFDAAGAAAAAQAFSIQRANHTGTQAESTVVNLVTDLAGKQPLDSDLTAIAALTTTSFGRSFLTLADAAAARTLTGAGTGNGTVTSIGLLSTDFSVSGSPVTASGSITANLNTSGVSAGTYNGTVTLNNKGIATAATNLSQTDNVVRALNSNFTPSATQRARLYYSLNIAWTVTAILSSSGTVFLEYSVNGGSSFTTIMQSGRAIGALTLGLTGNDDMNVSGEVPVNALVRLRTTSSNATITYVKGSEVFQ